MVEAEDLLASVATAMAAVDAYQFSLAVTESAEVKVDGTGGWASPNRYSLSIREPLCPPAAPGVPAPTDCDFFVTYEEVGIEDEAERRYSGPSRLQEFGLAFLADEPSPIAHLVAQLDLSTGALEVSVLGDGSLDGEWEYVVSSADGATAINIDPETSFPVSARSVITGGAAPRTLEWTFMAHGESFSVEPFE